MSPRREHASDNLRKRVIVPWRQLKVVARRVNAVRAAFKAGVKPSAIARQFGISKSDVRKALASDARDPKSGR